MMILESIENWPKHLVMKSCDEKSHFFLITYFGDEEHVLVHFYSAIHPQSIYFLE